MIIICISFGVLNGDECYKYNKTSVISHVFNYDNGLVNCSQCCLNCKTHQLLDCCMGCGEETKLERNIRIDVRKTEKFYYEIPAIQNYYGSFIINATLSNIVV